MLNNVVHFCSARCFFFSTAAVAPHAWHYKALLYLQPFQNSPKTLAVISTPAFCSHAKFHSPPFDCSPVRPNSFAVAYNILCSFCRREIFDYLDECFLHLFPQQKPLRGLASVLQK
uniref:Uncharacterized protein n=1 Tax=Cacopsylla melanoneura TaxID=428564 RepID=A0A8D9FEM4_9HEMI